VEGQGRGNRHIRKVVAEVGKDKRVCLTGTTGMAALNLGPTASTIHRFAGLLDGRFSNSYLAAHVTTEAWGCVREKVRACDVLLVDEASMMSARTFEQVKT
jgi:ATP-dependent exoDNAse (exonuclease V) alpha subunit